MTDFLEFMQMENSHKTGTIPVEKRLDGEYEIEFKDERASIIQTARR